MRRLSVILLIDLLRLERIRSARPRSPATSAPWPRTCCSAGDYAAALDVTAALAEQAGEPGSRSPTRACRTALDSLADTVAFREAAELFGEMDEPAAVQFTRSLPAHRSRGRRRLRDRCSGRPRKPRRCGRARPLIVEIRGPRGDPPGAARQQRPLVSSSGTSRDLLGQLGAPEAVPLLQPLLRGTDPRVMQAAVQALSNIDDPAAARAIHTVLRAATGEHRLAVVNALVKEKDPRAVPLLGRILAESNPLGADHQIVLETLGAIGDVGGDQAIAQVSA